MITFILPLDFSEVKYLALPPTFFTFSLADNLKSSNLFTIATSSGVGSFYLLNISSANASTTNILTYGSVARDSSAINMGAYQYFLVLKVVSGYSTLMLLNKVDFGPLLAVPGLTPPVTIFMLSAAGCYQVNNLLYFAVADNTTSNSLYFKSYLLTINDMCTYRDNSLICHTCISGYYLSNLTANNSCINQSIPGFGLNTATNTLLPCSDPNCSNCSANFAQCVQCSNSSFTLLPNSSCRFTPSSPSPTSPSSAAPAPSSLSLLSAAYDFQSQSATLTFDAEVSLAKANDTAACSFRLDDLVYPERTLNCSDMTADLRTLLAYPNRIVINLNSNYSVLLGRLYISNSSLQILRRSDGLMFAAFPIVVNDVVIGRPSQPVVIAIGAMQVANYVRVPFNFLGVLGSPTASVFLDILFNQFIILQLFEGPFLTYPEEMLANTSVYFGILPFQTPNPFQDWIESDDDCTPSPRFVAYQLGCNFLTNFGVDQLYLASLFLLTATVTTLCRLLLKRYEYQIDTTSKVALPGVPQESEKQIAKPVATTQKETATPNEQNPPRLWGEELFTDLRNSQLQVQRRRLMYWSRTYGLELFLFKVDANQLQIILVSMINLRYWSSSASSAVGGIDGIVWICLFMLLVYQTVRRSKQVWVRVQEYLKLRHKHFDFDGHPFPKVNSGSKQTESPNETVETSSRSKSMLIDAPEELKERMGIFQYFLLELRLPSTFFKLIAPHLFLILKSFSLSLTLVLVINNPLLQILLGVVLESAYLVVLIHSNLHVDRIYIASEVVREICFVTYLVLKSISTSSAITEYVRQEVIGLTMAFILAIMLVISILFIIYSIIWLMISLTKELRKKVTNKTTPLKHANNIMKAIPIPIPRKHESGISSSRSIVKPAIKIPTKVLSPNTTTSPFRVVFVLRLQFISGTSDGPKFLQDSRPMSSSRRSIMESTSVNLLITVQEKSYEKFVESNSRRGVRLSTLSERAKGLFAGVNKRLSIGTRLFRAEK